jgi:hypothetical protein
MRVGDANGPWKFSATAERTSTDLLQKPFSIPLSLPQRNKHDAS